VRRGYYELSAFWDMEWASIVGIGVLVVAVAVAGNGHRCADFKRLTIAKLALDDRLRVAKDNEETSS